MVTDPGELGRPLEALFNGYGGVTSVIRGSESQPDKASMELEFVYAGRALQKVDRIDFTVMDTTYSFELQNVRVNRALFGVSQIKGTLPLGNVGIQLMQRFANYAGYTKPKMVLWDGNKHYDAIVAAIKDLWHFTLYCLQMNHLKVGYAQEAIGWTWERMICFIQ